MIDVITKAIKEYYDSASGAAVRAVNTGGLYFNQAPQTAQEPYTVFMWVASAVDDYMGGSDNRIERADVQFSIFSRAEDGGVEITNISNKFMSWFDEANLTLDAPFKHIRNERNGTASIPIIDDVWQITLLYTIWFSWS